MYKYLLPGILFLSAFSPKSLQASVTPHYCHTTISEISEQIYGFGTSVQVDIFHDADKYNIGNPTVRDGRLLVIFGEVFTDSNLDSIIFMYNQSKTAHSVAENIGNSTELQNNWANQLVINCPDIAVVSFGIAHTGHIIDYAVQNNGYTTSRKCLNTEGGMNMGRLPWNYQACGF